MAPCLARSFTQAPSRPTTSESVPVAAPATIWSCVVEYGPLMSLTVIPGFWAWKSSIIARREPAGSSGSHHWANSIVTPPELLVCAATGPITKARSIIDSTSAKSFLPTIATSSCKRAT